VGDATASDRFLWDFRQTLGDLMAESHYDQVSNSAHERGLGRYGESHEFSRVFVGDGMRVKKSADIPMGAMWAASNYAVTQEGSDADIRESASVAHIYGKSFVAAESLTAYGYNKEHVAYSFSPAELKPTADRLMSLGLNRFVLHTSVHQPVETVGPGAGLGPFGLWFTRNETWAEEAGPWVSYLARSSYLLQQGRYVADIAYLYGEDTNLTSLFVHSAPPIPAGYSFDYINADAVVNELSVKDGRLTTHAGMTYRVLALDPSTRHLSLPVLSKLRDLVHAGATVVGARPFDSPSLADDSSEFKTIVAELWGNTPGVHAMGAGKVFAGGDIESALKAAGVTPDVQFRNAADNTDSMTPRFVHRTVEGEGEVYFLSSGTDHTQTLDVSFRLSGREPELWRAEHGTAGAVSYRVENGRTIVPLTFEPNGAVFIVFRKPTQLLRADVRSPVSAVVATLSDPWQVSFPPDRGAPAKARFAQLSSWTESDDPGIKYFSGTASYSQDITVKGGWVKGPAHLQIDLGGVKNLAEVVVNGRSLGVAWNAPFRLDATAALRPGKNHLEVKVTNVWVNRLIGDQQPGARKIAYATFDPFKAKSALLPAGLLGPVTLVLVK
jgi:hypothetical protein